MLMLNSVTIGIKLKNLNTKKKHQKYEQINAQKPKTFF